MALLTYAAGDRSEARRLQRLADGGKLRRIYPRIYTDDLSTSLEVHTRREICAICALLAPQSIISHRSALEGNRAELAELPKAPCYYRLIFNASGLPSANFTDGVTAERRSGLRARSRECERCGTWFLCGRVLR